jgi:hypothetical protein
LHLLLIQFKDDLLDQELENLKKQGVFDYDKNSNFSENDDEMSSEGENLDKKNLKNLSKKLIFKKFFYN